MLGTGHCVLGKQNKNEIFTAPSNIWPFSCNCQRTTALEGP